MMGSQLAAVIDNACAYRNSDIIVLRCGTESLGSLCLSIFRIILNEIGLGKVSVENGVRHLDIAPLGVELFLIDDIFGGRDSRSCQVTVNGLSCCRPSIDVSDNNSLAAGE